jgi:HlyD family secretion protein
MAGLGMRVSGVSLAVPEDEKGAAAYLTAPVERGDMSTTLSATGTLRALVTVQVGSQLSGQIADLLVDFNDEVSEGESLARLDPRTFQSEVRQAEAALEVARAEVLKQRAELKAAASGLASAHHSFEVAEAGVDRARAKLTETERDLRRKRALAGTEALPQAHVEQATTANQSAAADLRAAEAGVEIAREAVVAAAATRLMVDANLLYAEAAEKQKAAELDQARIDLDRTVIVAPIDGVVIGRDVDRGQTVAASLEAPTLFTLARDLRQMEVHANIDEADIGQIRIGQQARFTVDAYPDRAFTGTVTQIRKAPEVVENVVTYTVVLSTQNPDLALLPGMTALVEVVVDETTNVLQVPNAALRFQPVGGATANTPTAATPHGANAGAVVWVLGDDGAPEAVAVGLGRSDDRATEITDGSLRPGQQVIIGTALTAQEDSWFGISWRL